VIPLLAGFLLLALHPPVAPPPAPLLLENAVVYVSADAKPARASILVEDGRILFVGDPARAKELARGARAVDLTGRYVFPGWADSHLHLLGVGKALSIADLRGASDAAAAASRMAEKTRGLAPATWAEGRGWDQNLWPGREFPDARTLDRLIPDRPAVAGRVDGHAFWVNTAALRAAGIDSSTKDPDGGRILRRSDGTPSGVLVDNAMDLVARAMPPPAAADLDRWLSAGAEACARAGLTEIQDASAYAAAAIASLERLASSGRLPIRVYATVSPEPDALAKSIARGARVGGGTDFLTVRAVKAYADGALGSRGAALLTDYTDEAGKTGLLVTSPERLAEIARETRQAGWQLWIHAIGDRGNRIALDAFASAAAARPQAPDGASRPRIEHAQVIAPEDFPRFAALSVIASVQPTHATSDMPWAEARLGPTRVTGAYAWRRLKDAGAKLTGGSDAPVESENPLLGFYSAVTRQSLDGKPAGGWRPSEKLTRPEALALFTSDAAFAAFEESWRGRIAAGYAADLTVLAGDPLAVPAPEIPGISAVLTMVGGRIAYGPAAP